jgi:hypothetical protein
MRTRHREMRVDFLHASVPGGANAQIQNTDTNPNNHQQGPADARDPDDVWYLGVWNRKRQLQSYCIIVAWVHIALTFIYMVVTIDQDQKPLNDRIPRLITQVTQNLGTWLPKADIKPVDITGLGYVLDLDKCPVAGTTPSKDSKFAVQQTVLSLSDLDTRGLIIAFHALSGVFQLMTGLDENYKACMETFGRVNVVHFIEYSISATVMLLAISAQLGITDLYTLFGIAGNCWSCMIFGLLAELLLDSNIKLTITFPKIDSLKRCLPANFSIDCGAHWISHFAGWITIIVAVICTSSNLITYAACALSSSQIKPPDVVYIIVSVEGVLFLSFGLVQTVSFYFRGRTEDKQQKTKIAEWAEFTYITLSATAKIFLGAFIMINNFTNQG